MTTCPHCLGGGCLHCRERAAEASGRQRRSRLTNEERERLELMPLRPLRFQVPGAPAQRHSFSHGFQLTVLPASFQMALDCFEPAMR
jgi:hypothetical protein